MNLQPIKQFYVSLTNFLVSFEAPVDCNDVLILRLDELGDFVLWLDSAQVYRNIFPKKRITLLVNKKWITLAKKFHYWDEVIGLDTFKFRFNPDYRLKWLRYIRNLNFQTTVCPRYFIQFLLEPSIMAICGSEQKIVYGGYFPKEKWNYYTRMIPPRHGIIHELIRNADFVRYLGMKEFQASIPKLPANKNGTMKYIVFAPTAFRKQKEWPMVNYLELMARIGQRRRINIVVVNNQKLNCKFPLNVINITGKTDILKLMDCIANANLVIGNDSGPIHIAAACGVPSVCIGIGRHGAMFHPYPSGLKGQIPKGIFREDVKSIAVDEVWDIVKEMV